MSMKDNHYAISNLRTIAESVHAYASYSDVDKYGEFQERVEEAANAVKELADWLESQAHFEKAINYVREHKTWSDAAEQKAYEVIERYRCNIQQADSNISDEIHDLMEEYSEENDLPEGWWMYEGDEDDIFNEL